MSYHFTSLLHICTFFPFFCGLLPAGFFRFLWFILHRTRKRPLMPFLLISLLPCRCQTSRSRLQLFLNASARIWIHARDRESVYIPILCLAIGLRGLIVILNLARCPDMRRTSWVPSSQRSGQDPQAGPHWLTRSLDQRSRSTSSSPCLQN